MEKEHQVEQTVNDVTKEAATAINEKTTDGKEIAQIDEANIEVLDDKKKKKKIKKPKNPNEGFSNFLYNPRQKTVLGKDGLGWAKLSAFYTGFYFFQGCFFLLLLYVFALFIDRHVPTYFNTESTMSVRTSTPSVGMGYRPQPVIDDNIIRISDNPREQARIASSLRLYRDVFLIQKADAKTEKCTEKDSAGDLPPGYACAFNWFHVVENQDHPCSDNNMYGFRHEEPCVLVKVNKIYGWTPPTGALPVIIQNLRGIASNKSVIEPDVYVTCAGTNYADNDALTNITYYSLDKPSGSTKYGAIPNYYFPYRNARDHVQPFVLVQFKDLPYDRLVSVTCRLWYPGVEHETRTMRSMVTFQLYRTRSQAQVNPIETEEETQ